MSKIESPTMITDRIYNDDEILSLTFTSRYIVRLFQKDKYEILKVLASLKLIKNFIICECSSPMRIIKNRNKKSGFWWVCKGNALCKKNRSVYSNTIFENSNLSAENILLLLYYWAADYPQRIIVSETNVGRDTISEWCAYFRDIIAESYLDSPELIGGVDDNGVPIDVEIDESQFYKRKSNRGRIGNPIWVFGGIERNTRKSFLVSVPNRSRDTLMEIINQKIKPGSRIISDKWAAYRCLYQSTVYSHEEINHSVNFIDPNDFEIHTQNVECMWNHAKTKLRNQHGTSSRLFEGYLIEFMFRYSNFVDKHLILNIFLNILRNKDFRHF